jgi:hypothetical protein
MSVKAIVIQYCTQRQAKQNGTFVISRDTKEQIEDQFRILTREMRSQNARGSIKITEIPTLGYCIFYFDKREIGL